MLDLSFILLSAALVIASCYSLGRFVFGSLDLPQTIRFGIGAAILSHIVFFLLATGTLYSKPLTALLVLLVLPLFRLRPPAWSIPDRSTLITFGPIAAIFGVVYGVHALAPEIQPDAAGYHLGLVREWHIHNAFADRIGFYEVLPQGMETLFATAFDVGGHSAAKLIHFAFLAATVPLLFATARQLGMERWQGGVAAVLYGCAPVVGVSGTCAYNDAALVFFTLGAFYLLLRWHAEPRWQLLACAGLMAGFCYSIKVTGLLVPALAIGYFLMRRRPKAALLLGGAAALMILPWMIRNIVWTGNPLAPLLNALFENPYFHIGTERVLSEVLRSYSGVAWHEIPLELTIFGEKLQGLIGPAFLLAPLAITGVRHRTGRILLVAAALLSVPWALNLGARFLMPSLAFVALAMAATLPRKAATALAVLHAVLALPAVLDLYAQTNAWRLKGLPITAALRFQPEADYLREALLEYNVAELVSESVPPAAAVLELFPAPSSYHDAATVGPWHSAAADRMREALELGRRSGHAVYSEFDARWEARPLIAVRVRLAESNAREWSVNEVRFRGPELDNRAGWTLAAWPNIWEAPAAVDGNLITKWSAWEPARADMYVQVNFGAPFPVSGASVISQTGEEQRELEFLGQQPDGKWVRLAETPNMLFHPSPELQRTAMAVVKANGAAYIVAPVSGSPFAELGRALVDKPWLWGVEVVGRWRDVYLLRIE